MTYRTRLVVVNLKPQFVEISSDVKWPNDFDSMVTENVADLLMAEIDGSTYAEIRQHVVADYQIVNDKVWTNDSMTQEITPDTPWYFAMFSEQSGIEEFGPYLDRAEVLEELRHVIDEVLDRDDDIERDFRLPYQGSRKDH